MKKNLLIFPFCLLMLFSIVRPGTAASTTVSISVSDRQIGFSLMQQTAAGFFQLQVGEFKDYQQSSAPAGLFSVLYLAMETGDSPQAIHKKQKGKGWGKIAKELGLPANFHGKYMSSKHKHKFSPVNALDDATYELMMAIRFLHEYYGVDPELLYDWYSRGLSDYDLFIAVNLSARLQISPVDLFVLRISGKNWRFIARKYKVDYDSLGQPVLPNTKFKNNKKIPPGQAKKKK
ncbi:MAG: hypothetical protein GX050_05580 [Firmicutes bacterium]|nr:hypothetical protein [Bacillota bacterium]